MASTQQFSAINTLVQRVRDYLTANGVTAFVGFGWYKTVEQDNIGEDGNRVIFEPADGNNAGKLGPPRGGPGWFLETMPDGSQKWVRVLYSWERTFNVYAWTAPVLFLTETQEEVLEEPHLQEESNAELLEWVIRAIRASGSVWAQLGSISYVKADTQKQIGREMKVQVTLTGNILDVPLEPVTPDPNSRVNRP